MLYLLYYKIMDIINDIIGVGINSYKKHHTKEK
jgi:hypothetical protein